VCEAILCVYDSPVRHLKESLCVTHGCRTNRRCSECHYAVHSKCRDFATTECPRTPEAGSGGAGSTAPGQPAPVPKKPHIAGDGPKLRDTKIYDAGKYEEYVKIGKQLEKSVLAPVWCLYELWAHEQVGTSDYVRVLRQEDQPTAHLQLVRFSQNQHTTDGAFYSDSTRLEESVSGVAVC
jgi:hypothetical protein